MLFFRKTNDLKVRENRQNSLEDNQIYNFSKHWKLIQHEHAYY